MNNELRKNAEGYADPTAAATLNKKEPGDIWEYKGGECLIIKGHSGFATILRLHDSNKYGDRIEVTERPDGTRYVDPAFVITGRHSEMGQYVETLDVNTFARVTAAVADTMGLAVGLTETADTEETAALREELTAAREHMKAMESLQRLKQAELQAANTAATKARNQLELLREMYNDLLLRALRQED